MNRNSNITSQGGALVAKCRLRCTFGNTIASSGNYANLNKYRFSTKPLDEEVAGAKLYYYGCRFISRDHIEEQGVTNLYILVSGRILSYSPLAVMDTL